MEKFNATRYFADRTWYHPAVMLPYLNCFIGLAIVLYVIGALVWQSFVFRESNHSKRPSVAEWNHSPSQAKGAISVSTLLLVLPNIFTVVFFLLQINGVRMNWMLSSLVYVVLAAIALGVILKSELSVWTRRLSAVAALLLVLGLGVWGTTTEYKREHPTTNPEIAKKQTPGPNAKPESKPTPPKTVSKKRPTVPVLPVAPPPAAPTPIVSPDPYFGHSDAEVADWALEEASEIYQTGADCLNKAGEAERRKLRGQPIAEDHPGPEYYFARFWQEYDGSIKQKLVILRQSLQFRIGTVALTREEIEEFEILMKAQQSDRPKWAVCSELEAYSSHLTEMGNFLKAKAK